MLAARMIPCDSPFHPGYLTRERIEKARKLKLALTAGIGALALWVVGQNQEHAAAPSKFRRPKRQFGPGNGQHLLARPSGPAQRLFCQHVWAPSF